MNCQVKEKVLSGVLRMSEFLAFELGSHKVVDKVDWSIYFMGTSIYFKRRFSGRAQLPAAGLH